MFELHGQLSRTIVPPAGTMAVVEFEQADEAAKAFRAVAYRRLGSSVVYLEKGPMGMFQETTDAAGNSDRTLVTAFKPITIAEQEDGSGADADEPALSAGTTLFVKNLAFSTTAERLTGVFRGLSGFSFARVQTKPDPKRPTVSGAEAPRLSMGYGFVGFKTAEDAKKAMKSMQSFILDGHSLHVKFAGRGTEDEPKDNTVAKSRSTKMIVKNVPFEATKKDIRELFRSVLSTVYVPNISHSTRTYVVPMVISNPYVFRRSSTRVRVVSRSWSSSPGTKRRTHTPHYDTRIYLGDILSSSGRKRLNRT
jgi:multiple RNA-binding domain-containing protein 1